MKLPISNRLLCCASMLTPGCRVADIGTDHGYLAIHLLQSGVASSVVAADLREQPLAKARRNARRYGVTDRLRFVLSDGLAKIDPGEADTVICAGMGGDCIIHILDSAAWLRDARYTLVLQPQSAGQAMRKYLTDNGFAIEKETLAKDGGFYYTVLRARFGKAAPLTPGEQYVSPQLLASGSELLPAYLARIEAALRTTVEGLQSSQKAAPERVTYYTQALQEVEGMRHDYGTGCV